MWCLKDDKDYWRRASEGVKEFIKLRKEVSRRWRGPSVLEEFRRSRRHYGKGLGRG